MARKSRQQEQLKKLLPSPTDTVAEVSPTIYKTAIYARLSANNFATTNVDVLGSQLNHLKEYVASHSDMQLIDTYVDDGWSGINFNRPDFTRMMDDMKTGKINCIVVRDFSRFGRNYLETGYYLHEVFPAYNMRFISVFDEFDSLVSDADSMIFSMMQIINDFYCKDISRKICSVYDAKVQKGSSWGKVPFGYYRRDDGTGRLLMDEKVCHIAYLIFYWGHQKTSPTDIADNLNLLGFPYSQSESNYLSRASSPVQSSWYHSAVRSVLTNPLYTGDYVYNRFRNRKYDASHLGKLPMERWQFVQHTHPGYISKTDYLEFQSYITERKDSHELIRQENARKRDNPNNPFYKLLYCGECSHPLKSIRNNENFANSYSCKGHFQVQAAGHLSFSVERSSLMASVRQQLSVQIDEANSLLFAIRKLPITEIQDKLEQKKRREIQTLKKQQEILFQKTHRAKKDHQHHILDEEIFNLQIEKLEMEQSVIQDELSILNEQLNELRSCFCEHNVWLAAFAGLRLDNEIPSNILNQLINRIEVFSDGRVTISYQHTDQKQKFIRYLEEWNQVQQEVQQHGE